MNVLVIGNGGREHALCYGIHKSNKCDSLFCVPGYYFVYPESSFSHGFTQRLVVCAECASSDFYEWNWECAKFFERLFYD